MSSSQLHNKTVRPGSLNGYSYYYSNRQPPAREVAKPVKNSRKLPRKLFGLIALLALIAVPLASYALHAHNDTSVQPAPIQQAKSTPPAQSNKAAASTPAPTNYCAGNTLDKFIKVSISQRHIWACQASNKLYDSAVITGMSAQASTVTPPGTYHIYAKQANTTLTGSDETGSWNDPVYYWMPFLNNQYGIYGFHDATWRADTAFGKVSPDSSDASHGCVELPLATSKWLYNWAEVGTTLTIES